MDTILPLDADTKEFLTAILGRLFAVLRQVIYQAYLYSYILKNEYPSIYNFIYYIIQAYVIYKVIRITITSLYSTIKSIIKGLIITYIVYLVVSVLLLIDEQGGEVDLQQQVAAVTAGLLQRGEDGFRLVKLLYHTLVQLGQPLQNFGGV